MRGRRRSDGEFGFLEHAADHGEDVALVGGEGVWGEGDGFEPFALYLISQTLLLQDVPQKRKKKKE